jgi:hypothetical protein
MTAVKPLLVVALLAAFAVGCSTGLSVVGGAVDAGPPGDVALDATVADKPDVSVMDSPDVSAMDAPADAPALDADVPALDADVPARCAANADCAGDPGGPVCDTATGRCVACTAASDLCPDGRYCDDASRTCVPGCRDDLACSAPAPGDGGASPADGGSGPGRRCDRVSRTCVACLANPDCPAGTLCVGNLCVTGCTADSPCPSSQTCCAGACVDPLANVAHCGACDRRCAVPNGSALCLNGNCTVGACASPFGNCDGDNANGCETNTLTAVAHCGACGAGCAAPANATANCTAGACGFTCNAGFADCDGNAANGCEVDLRTDLTHCGSCTTVCNPPNGTPACVAGACAIAACSTGFGDCNLNPTDGCETNVRRDTGHCGGCGRACEDRANAFPGCLAGACVTSCVMGFQDCNSVEADGCEADLRTSAAHCGACGRACNPPNATGTCAAGACAVARCDDGFADCDANPANGCEVNLRSDPSHCAGCGMACMVAGGTPACTAGVCGLATCAAGRGDCDRASANGCEVDLTTDPRHCGGCGSACDVANATAGCAGGRCTVAACAAGFGDCNASPADGCEVNLNTTVSSCGACGRACSLPNATPGCAGGSCAIARCNDGFADCDGNPANGCEVNTQSTVGACGACGNACALANATPACAGGRCTVAGCNGGFADCDGSAANGCEVNVSGDPRNCGVCGRACSLPNTAVAGCGAGACTVVTCAGGFANCNAAAGDGCEVNTQTDANNCGGCGTRCPSGVCREGACQSYGGAFEASDPGCVACNNSNPFTGTCGCPGGFATTFNWRVINDCRGRGTQVGALATFCGASALGEFGGGFQSDDGVPGGLGCRSPNPYTGGCSCPGGYTRIGFRALADTSRGLIGSNPSLCIADSGPRPGLGGAFQVDDAVPGGAGCRAANPVTGACSCPGGYNGAPLRVEVDSSSGFIGSQVIVCVR